MRSAQGTLGLTRLQVVYTGSNRYAMAPRIEALPAARLPEERRPLRG
jgi:hypothetical protein